MSLSRACFIAVVALTAQIAGAQQAPQGERIAGTVKSITPSDLILATAKGDILLAITPQTRVLVRQAASASDIKQGAYLGTSNQNASEADTGTATEVHVMDNGPNVNYPMNSSGLTMTNGHVKTVTATATGQEMDIDYGKDTTRHVVVTTDTRISKMADVGVAGLKPGINVNAMTSAVIVIPQVMTVPIRSLTGRLIPPTSRVCVRPMLWLILSTWLLFKIAATSLPVSRATNPPTIKTADLPSVPDSSM